jgi:hypothetical protein
MILLLSVIKIQSLVRGRKERQQAGIKRLQAIILQAAGLMFLAKLERSRIHLSESDLRRSTAATKIQRSWRGYRANVSFCVVSGIYSPIDFGFTIDGRMRVPTNTSTIISPRSHNNVCNKNNDGGIEVR